MTNQLHDPETTEVPSEKELRHRFGIEDVKFKPSPKTEPRHEIETDANSPELVFPPSSSRKTSKKPRSVKRTILRILLIFLIVIVSLALIATGTVLVLRHIGKNQMLDTQNAVLSAPQELIDDSSVAISSDGRTVTYNGETYVFNENRTNILCVGTDKEALGTEDDVVGTGGQADAIFILSIDTETGEIDAVAIPRDTLVDVDIYNADGKFVRTENTQICLSYAYGDGKDSSCLNTVKSASRLFYGIPINTYAAIDLSAIATLNDAVGGVSVTLREDFKRNDGTFAKAGQTITLVGDEAERFVRERDVEVLDSNMARMERQKQFLTAFFSKAISAASEDIGVPLALFDKVSGNSVTNLNSSRITYLATTLVTNHQPLVFHSVAGEVIKGEDGYAEYKADYKTLYEKVLEVFYEKQ